MAGLGRRTHYRKHLTDRVLHDFPIPSSDERIAKIVATRGGNQFDIILPLTAKSGEEEEQRTPQLAILPTKFRKLVWLKRNDYVIVQTGEEEDTLNASEGTDTGEVPTVRTGSIRYIINHILYKDQVKHLKTEGLWPLDDVEFNDSLKVTIPNETSEVPANIAEVEEIVGNENSGSEGEDYLSDDQNDDDLFVNTNRIKNLVVEDSSSESEDG